MRSTGDDHRVAKAMQLHVVGGFETQLVVRVANAGLSMTVPSQSVKAKSG